MKQSHVDEGYGSQMKPMNNYNNQGAYYPEAVPTQINPYAPPVEGEPLYGPETQQNRDLARFVASGWRDLWAALLFYLVFGGSIVWGIVNYVRHNMSFGSLNHIDTSTAHFRFKYAPSNTGECAICIIIMILVSVVVGFLMLVLVKRFSYQIIYVSNVLSICLMLVIALFAFVSHSYILGAVALFCGFLNAVWFYFALSRIPFSAALLKSSARVIAHYKAIVMISLGLIVVFTLYMIVWIGVWLPYFTVDNSSNNMKGLSLTFAVFALFWVSQVMYGVITVTASGVTATQYYAGRENMPTYPTKASFKRATTTSFGSICFGSLIVSIIELIRFLINSAESDNSDGSSFLACCLMCLLSIIESIVEYINSYAFVYIAIYGSDYIDSAKRTFTLIQNCFCAAIFNDALIEPALNILTLFTSLLLFGAVYIILGVIWAAFQLVIALIVLSLFMTSLKAAATTYFVCYAETPQALARSDPELYQVVQSADNNTLHPTNTTY